MRKAGLEGSWARRYAKDSDSAMAPGWMGFRTIRAEELLARRHWFCPPRRGCVELSQEKARRTVAGGR
jgi:hypothetical protein